jgi:glyoxylase-like metal-dependent hydrolase (beta-lactamase superfamily II)
MASLLGAAAEGFLLILDPVTIGFILLGTTIGMVFGALPGLGGTIALALLIPVSFGMEPQNAVVMFGAALGGVARHYLSHRDELGESINAIRERFGTRLGGHRLEYDDFARIRPPDIVFDKRDTDPDGIEIIPTPGHTPGSTCFFVHSTSGGRYLFTGDTLFLNNDGIWKAGYIEGISDREALAASLERLRALEPDLVVSSACPGGVGVRAVEPAQWPAHVERARSELLR